MREPENGKAFSLSKFFDKWGSILTFAVLILVFCILSPSFRTGDNVINILTQCTPTLIVALGMTFSNMVGESDLSMGGVMGLSASLFCGFVASGSSPWLAAAVSIGAALAFGLLNGLLVSYAGLSSFVTTISTMFLAQGCEYAYCKGQSLWVKGSPALQIVTAEVAGIPWMVIGSLLLFAAVYLVMHQTKAGVHIQSIGLSQDAARFAGIPVKPLKLTMFCMASLFYALGGIVNALRSSGSIVYSGQKLLLPVMAVTFIAKTVLGTKRSNIPGILFGALMLTCISSAFTQMGLKFYHTYIAQGVVLLFAAILSVSDRSVILQEDLR